MIVELTTKELLSLVRGTAPSYDVYKNSLVKKGGAHVGGFADEWRWGPGLEDLTDEQLWELYIICKES